MQLQRTTDRSETRGREGGMYEEERERDRKTNIRERRRDLIHLDYFVDLAFLLLGPFLEAFEEVPETYLTRSST